MGVNYNPFVVPASAKAGPALMRVSMKRGIAANSCEVFDRGEAEDHTVNISSSVSVAASVALQQKTLRGLSINPNPVKIMCRYNWARSEDLYNFRSSTAAASCCINKKPVSYRPGVLRVIMQHVFTSCTLRIVKEILPPQNL